MRGHRRLNRLVHGYLDHEVHGDDAIAAARHLEECFDCSTDAELRTLVRVSLRRGYGTPSAMFTRLRRYAARLAAGP